VAAAARSGGLTGEEVAGVFARLGPDLPTEQRGLDQLPPSGALPGEQSRQDAGQKVLPGDVVGHRRPDRARVAAAPPVVLINPPPPGAQVCASRAASGPSVPNDDPIA